MIRRYKIAKICLLLIAAFICVSVVRFSIIKKGMGSTSTDIRTVIESYEEEYLRTFLENSILDYYHATKLRAQTLRSELLTEFSKQELEDELSSKYSQDFYNIVNGVLNHRNPMLSEGNPGCNTYLANRNGVISYFSNEDKHNTLHEEYGKTMKWEDFYAEHPELESAIYQLLYTNKIYVILDPDYNIVTLEEVLEIYNEKGLEDLKWYRVLTCAEITDDGDILGNPDKSFMQPNDNYKLYIINSIDLYDIVAHEDAYIRSIKTDYASIANKHLNPRQATNTMLINVAFGLVIFGFVAVLYSDKFEDDDE